MSNWTDNDLRALAEHLGLEAVRGGHMELILRAKNGNEALIWAWAGVDDSAMDIELGTPTVPCTYCRGRGWHLTASPGMAVYRRTCHCGAPEREDAAYDRTFDGARREFAAYESHRAAGGCTLHNGRHYCGRGRHMDRESFPFTHDFTGPLVHP